MGGVLAASASGRLFVRLALPPQLVASSLQQTAERLKERPGRGFRYADPSLEALPCEGNRMLLDGVENPG